ncbi:10144_t:CDS:2, partial [Scutellospora calospora]
MASGNTINSYPLINGHSHTSSSLQPSSPAFPSSQGDTQTPRIPMSHSPSVRKKGVNDFEFGKTLGEGSYSTVVFAIDRSSRREYAVKILEKKHIIKEKKVKYVNIEKNTLNKMNHPGIVRLYYTFQDQNSLYFVLDHAKNGELLTFIKK